MARTELGDGPTSKTVRANVRRLREELGYSYAALSRRLEDAGHPLAVLALRRIEDGERRITVDDLTALAIVLGVNANALLAPSASENSGITGASAATDEVDAALWLLGLDVLPGMQVTPLRGETSMPPISFRALPGFDTERTILERYAFWQRVIPESDSTWPQEAMWFAQGAYDRMRTTGESLYLYDEQGDVVVGLSTFGLGMAALARGPEPDPLPVTMTAIARDLRRITEQLAQQAAPVETEEKPQDSGREKTRGDD